MSITPLYLEDCKKYYLTDKIYLQGYSCAGDRTGFMIYPHKILFDCGVRTQQAPEYILTTHSHIDHTGELPYICNRHKLFEKDSYKVYTPESTISALSMLIKGISVASFPESINVSIEETLKHQKINLIPINAKDKFLIKNYEIEVFPAYHSVQSVGYGISSCVKKLKEEYSNIEKTKLIKLKKSGIDILENKVSPEIVLYCDSTIENLKNHEDWKKYPIIVCECTNFDEKISDEHTSLFQLLPIMLENIDKLWCLIHTSRKLKDDMIEVEEIKLKSYGLNIKIMGRQ